MGRRIYTVRFKDLRTGEMLPDVLEDATPNLVWAEDGRTLYAGEQSPDAFVHALDAQTLQERWTLRLADAVQSSTPPTGEPR